ncbi:MAG: hypothetical protein KTR21_08230 [Rhodobacteraceae bacterium]|nr:hypothetical protein [Paracoccaceae bacterium]
MTRFAPSWLRHPWPLASTPYWVWLHVIAIELAAMMLFTLALNLGPSEAALIGHQLQVLAETMGGLIWLTIPIAFLFGIYARPYHWFWWSMTGLAVMHVVLSFLSYLVPWGQISFWHASTVDRLSEETEAGLVTLSSLSILALIGAHIRQLARAQASAPYRGRYSWLGVGLILLYVGYLGLEGWRDHAELAALSAHYGVESAAPSSAPSASPAAAIPPGHPLITPAHIAPKWNVLPFYALLRAIPDKLGGVLAMLAALLIWPLAPWLDRGPPRPFWRRPGVRWVAPLILATLIALGWTGAQPAEGGALLAAQILGAAYFALFLIALPLASRHASHNASHNASRHAGASS